MKTGCGFWLALALSVTVSRLNGQTSPIFSIDETLRNAAFNTQRMPTEEMLVTQYGRGKISIRPGRIYHVYYLPTLRLWLRCKGDTEDRLYRPISEIMISAIDLGSRQSAKGRVLDPNIKGTRVGDDLQRALDQWGEPLRQYTASLGGIRTKVHEFFPPSLGPGLCVRFYSKGKKIVALTFSSEE